MGFMSNNCLSSLLLQYYINVVAINVFISRKNPHILPQDISGDEALGTQGGIFFIIIFDQIDIV